MRELAVIIVSYNSESWLVPCLSSLYSHAGEVALDVIVVDNGSSDGSVELIQREFPQARTVRAQNRGFSAGNNIGLGMVDAPLVLFINPDTEILEGTFERLLELLDERPTVGLIGCKQVASDGTLHPTIRRFPSALRYLLSSLGSERLPFDGSWLGERVRDQSLYEQEIRCDWTSGSFMLARTEAVRAAGAFDERYFMYSEEPDLCLRMRRLAWETRHVADMTIIHHAGKAGLDERLMAQDAHSRRQYLVKNLPPVRRRLALASYTLGHVLRAGCITSDPERRRAQRACAMRALRTLFGRVPPPFEAVLRASESAASSH